MGIYFKLFSIKIEDKFDIVIEMSDIFYFSVVGSFMYFMVGIRFDIVYVVGLVSRFMSLFCKEYWMVVKWVLRYIRDIIDFKLIFIKFDKFVVRGYCDSDYVVDLDRGRLIIGYVF